MNDRLMPHARGYLWAPDDAGGGGPPRRVKPTIHVDIGDLPRVADEARVALGDAGLPVYRRGKMLVRPDVIDGKAADGSAIRVPGLAEIRPAGMLELNVPTSPTDR